MCSACWTNLESFHNFYLTVNRAKDNFLSKCMNLEATFRDGEITVENPTEDDDADFFVCKDEPMDVIGNDGTLPPVDNAFEDNLNCPFECENFAPEVTIDKRDFDAIFLEEFPTERDDKMETVTTVDQYVEQLASSDNIPVVQSRNTIRRKSPRSLQESRVRQGHAESHSKFSLIHEPEFQEVDLATKQRQHIKD